MFRRVMTAVIVLLLAGCATFAPPVQVERMPKSVPVPPEIAAKTRWALALSGGSARGFAHIGVLRVLDEAGLKPGLVCRPNAGSILRRRYSMRRFLEPLKAP